MDSKPENERVELELEAMRNVVQALSALSDENARARVLRWAAEHLTLSQASAQGLVTLDHPAGSEPRARQTTEIVDTSDLNLEGLESLFDASVSESGEGDAVGAEAGGSSSSRSRSFPRKSRSRHSA